jgi:hypothetical protein
MSVSSKVYVRKAVTDIDPRTGRPLSMLRIQDFGHDIGRGIMSSKIPVPRTSIDYESVVRPDYRFPVGEMTSRTSDKYPEAYARAKEGNYPRIHRGSEWKYKPDMGRGYVLQDWDLFGGGDESVVEPNQGLFFTPGNLQDIGSAVVTGTDEYAPSRLVGVTSNPRGEGVHIRPPGSQQELLNEVFMTEDIPASQAYDLTPIYTRDRDYNPLWFGQKESPADRYFDDREELTRQNAADRGQLQGLARILNRNPAMFHRPTSKPLTFDEKTFTNLADQAGVDPSIYRLDDESDEYTYADPGPMMDFLREKINLRPMDRGYRQAMARRGMQPNFSQRTFGIPDGGFSQMPIDEFNLPVSNNMEVPPEYFDEDPEMGFARQGIDFDGIMERINALDMAKSDTSISSDSLASDMGHEPCSCCSPMQQASMALLEDYFEKAKKKSKPFHGYNPKRHHKKGGLNAKGRAKFKRETGANLKPPVTTKPSKLKPGSKRAKRRKSFCARMSGSKGPTSKDGKLTPKGAALKRWNC